MPFEVRIGATKFDRGNEGLAEYERIRQIAFEFGFSGWLRESTIVSLIEQFQVERVERGLRALHGRGNYSLQTLVGIIEGQIPAQRQAPQPQAPATQQVRTNGGPRNVADFLGEHGVKVPKPRRVQPTEGMFKLPELHRYLKERNLSVLDGEQIFYYCGQDSAGNDLWALRPEHTVKEKQ